METNKFESQNFLKPKAVDPIVRAEKFAVSLRKEKKNKYL